MKYSSYVTQKQRRCEGQKIQNIWARTVLEAQKNSKASTGLFCKTSSLIKQFQLTVKQNNLPFLLYPGPEFLSTVCKTNNIYVFLLCIFTCARSGYRMFILIQLK